MKILGEPLFARDSSGQLVSRIGTIFVKSDGLVTLKGVHATQRFAWIKELNQTRRAAGLEPLSDPEIDEEMANSVDLLFDDRTVLIRPDPNAMELAFEADEMLQMLVSKRCIRYLNTQDARVRDALRARGENWRMSRLPVSVAEMRLLISSSLAAIEVQPIYYYNRSTGTRFLTLAQFASLENLPDDLFRRQLEEIVEYAARRNRFWYPEIDIFPTGCAFTRQAFEALNTQDLPIQALRAAYRKLLDTFREALPAELHDESGDNIDWRNRMCSALTQQPNAVDAEELIQDISPEFYRQIEWLPGCRIVKGELIFDPVCDEGDAHPENADLKALCDPRAKAIIFNYLREYNTIEYINIGCIENSLSIRAPVPHRAPVYIVQLKEADKEKPDVRILRFQKWGVKEHLDDGKDLLRAVMEAMDYTDYILDRRLGCQQLGMNLPPRLATGRIAETYTGKNAAYHGARFWSVYFERAYVNGCATDKISPARYTNPEFNRRLARLLGKAAAVNCMVGRTNLDLQVIFDDGDEVIQLDADGLPEHLIVADHTGSFTQYDMRLERDAEAYAGPVNRRAKLMPNAGEFATCYLEAFQQRFEQVQQEYRRRRAGFDALFKHRPLDRKGSIAYRWQCVLARLDTTDAAALCEAIRSHVEVPVS
ncbi:MAG TPA: hypothetical protein P5026_01015 [Kiritimatiellia bacterium]|nr:hypothetical protein [Kiritimatiellia bacterium]HRU69822.1 hypothetical protein [Kiritimatiellia bacterium]